MCLGVCYVGLCLSVCLDDGWFWLFIVVCGVGGPGLVGLVSVLLFVRWFGFGFKCCWSVLLVCLIVGFGMRL